MNDFEEQMMQKAAEIIDTDPDLKKQSENREKNKIQIEKFFDKEDRLGNDDIERRPCTKEEKEKLDASIEQLGDLFADSNFFWQLDGALNISLYGGDYIGIHKDIDVSLDEAELDKAESFFAKKGYGFFLSSWNNIGKQRIFERVSIDKIKKNRSLQFMVVSVDSAGKLTYDNAVSHIEIHIVRRDEDGAHIGHEFTQLPQEWFEPIKIDFHGRSINCSHPALLAYYKLFLNRAYDDTDLKFLAQSGVLSEKDINIIEKTFNQHIDNINRIIKALDHQKLW